MARVSVLRRPLRARFSLRTLLLLVPVVALFAASVASELHEFRREQTAWSELSELGARRSGMSSERRQWAARLLGPLLSDMDRTTGVRLGFYTPRQLSPAELDQALALLQSLPRLRELSLRGLPITDAHLEQLTGFPELTHLNLQGTAINDAGIETLDAIPSLVYVTLADTAVTDAAIERVAKPEKARYWRYWSTVEELQAAEVFVSPVVGPPSPYDRRVGQYPALPTVEAIEIRGALSDTVHAKLQGFVDPVQVRRLSILTAQSSDRLRAFSAWSGLESFYLEITPDPSAKFDFSFAAEWTKLRHLQVLNAAVDVAALRSLADCRGLTSVEFASHAFDDAAVEALVKQHPGLTSLSIGGGSLTDRGLAAIASLPGLTRLSVSSHAITEAALESLADHPTLESIHTDWTRYRPETRARFGERAQ